MTRFLRLEYSEGAHFPISVRMGKCRHRHCQMFNKWGPVGSWCPSTHEYNTRSTHKFKRALSDSEKSESNVIDFQDSIGVCPIATCLMVGYPGTTCYRCLKYNVYKVKLTYFLSLFTFVRLLLRF